MAASTYYEIPGILDDEWFVQVIIHQQWRYSSFFACRHFGPYVSINDCLLLHVLEEKFINKNDSSHLMVVWIVDLTCTLHIIKGSLRSISYRNKIC